jgi:soluble lytic murein transglycosylase
MPFFQLLALMAAPASELSAAARADDVAASDETAVDDDEGAAVSEQSLEEFLESMEDPSPPEQTRRFSPQDFEPYFVSSSAQEAKAQFDQRHFARAQTLFELEGTPLPSRYLRALSALDAGDATTAASEFSALADAYSALSDLCWQHAGEAYEKLGKPAQAVQAYAQVRPHSTAFADSRFAMARVLKRRLGLGSAIDALKPLRMLPVGGRHDAVRLKALLLVTELAHQKGWLAEERRALTEIWATSPKAPEATLAAKRLDPAQIPDLWRVRRAEALLAANDNPAAIDAARQVRSDVPQELGCRAAFVIGNGLRKQRRHRKAIVALGPVVERCTRAELRPQAMYVMGYSQSVVDPAAAIVTYEALAHDYPEHPLADDALYFAGEIDQRLGKVDLALQRLSEVVTRYPNGNFAAESLFLTACIHRDAGALEQADAALASVDTLAHPPPREALLRAQYWRGRVMELRHDPFAPDVLRQLAVEHPTSWYGAMALQRVGLEPQPGPREAGESKWEERWPIDAGRLGADPSFLAGVELLRMGLPGAAVELLSADRRTLSDDAARLLVYALRRGGVDEAAAFVTRVTLGRDLGGNIEVGTRPVWEANFPRPFRDLVEKYSQEARLDADLLQALAREESRFNPYARSTTGAIGLAQLMPATANAVARELKLGRVSTGALMRPSVNLRLAATYLSELIREFGGRVEYAVAAYNAGPDAVRRWLRQKPALELDQWVEEIPVAETREYVKRVMASHSAYRLIYPRSPPVMARSP